MDRWGPLALKLRSKGLSMPTEDAIRKTSARWAVRLDAAWLVDFVPPPWGRLVEAIPEAVAGGDLDGPAEVLQTLSESRHAEAHCRAISFLMIASLERARHAPDEGSIEEALNAAELLVQAAGPDGLRVERVLLTLRRAQRDADARRYRAAFHKCLGAGQMCGRYFSGSSPVWPGVAVEHALTLGRWNRGCEGVTILDRLDGLPRPLSDYAGWVRWVCAVRGLAQLQSQIEKHEPDLAALGLPFLVGLLGSAAAA